MRKARKTKKQQKYKRQRDAALFMLKKHTELASMDIAQELSALSNQRVSDRAVRFGVQAVSNEKLEDIE
jgi:hypothetical protein